VSVTPAGTALLAELRTRKDAFLSARLEALGPEDRATLARAAGLLEDLLA
jgi:DNA-binding MarR family transcriptional regulator